MSPAIVLVLTLLGITAASSAMFWGLALFAQKALYNEPADKLPLRAAVAGLLLGCFLTGWIYVNTRADGENKYGVLHQFSPNDTSAPLTKFQAVRGKLDSQQKQIGEETVTFERLTTPNGLRYMPTNPKPTGEPKPFAVTAPGYFTTAIVVDDAGKSVRYDAVMNDKQQYQGEKYQFVDKAGGRTIELTRGLDAIPAEAISVVSPSGGTVFLAILLNLLHLVVWFVVFWPVLKFNMGHAIGFSVVFFAAATVLLMPLLFEQNKVAKTGLTPVTPATVKS